MIIPIDSAKITEIMQLLNHPSLDDSDEVNQAYNILEDMLPNTTYTTKSLHLTPPSQKYCEICRLRGIKKRADTEKQIDNIDYSLCWDCSLDEGNK
jgi:hypothetical protein